MRSLYLLFLMVLLGACQHAPEECEYPAYENRYDNDYDLYYMADTVIEHDDTVITINRKLDTTVMFTGFLTYPPHDFAVWSSPLLIALSQQAIALEDAHKDPDSIYARIAASCDYETDRCLCGCSDENEARVTFLGHAIIGAYANWKLHRIDTAIKILGTELANLDATQKMYAFFARLAIEKYGKEKFLLALDDMGKTAAFKKDKHGNYTWTIKFMDTKLREPFSVFANDEEEIITNLNRLITNIKKIAG